MNRNELKDRRKKKKMTRIELAQLLNVCISTVEKVETGKRNASWILAQKWSEVLDINIEERWDIFFNKQQDNMSCCARPGILPKTG